MFQLDLKRTQVAIAAGRLDEAFSLLKSSSARGHRDGQDLVDQLIAAFVDRGNQHFIEGRIDDAWHDASAAAYFGGRQIEVARLLAQIREVRTSERETPVGKLAVPKTSIGRAPVRQTPVRKPFEPEPQRRTGAMVLHVDGLGSLLLLRSDTVSIGDASSSSRHDITMQTDGVHAPIWIHRDGDSREGQDYFAKSASSFMVNGKTISERLLVDGDAISVGQRGRLRFTRPVAASGSAILEVTAAKLVRRDIRRVVLMADSLLFGSFGSHFRLPVGDGSIIMQPTRDGASDAAYTLHRQGGFDRKLLAMGGSVRFDDIRFALSPYPLAGTNA
ncbi:hypothetical protein [Neorhodopirellula lusitana]|uniref:hypothetical protein n=1 Tax=Neorhodopirellula lusitana TaxID=445327 RepID=UPI00384A8A51